MIPPVVFVAILVALTLLFDFFNGRNDSANTVATLIASRAMTPRRAMILVAVCELAGPFLFGVQVATTVGSQVIAPETVTIAVVMAALVAAIIWDAAALALGIPASSSHALIGGLIGAAAWGYGFGIIKIAGLIKVLVALFVSPILGLLLGFLVMRLMLRVARGATPKLNTWLRRAQWLTAAAVALSHGTNDSQKGMAVITMGLVATGLIPSFQVPLWVVGATAAAIALGTYAGGWSIIKTVGSRFFKVRPIHAFTSQVTSASIILGAALLGGPVSTTQVASSSVLGAGSGHRVSQVRWGVAKEMAIAWLLTMPVAGALAAILYIPISLLMR